MGILFNHMAFSTGGLKMLAFKQFQAVATFEPLAQT
jgi:hypothetical protein